eukprot:TRINITY_DN3552_c0_g1_i4.p1 TRINITY_DN3552_c0_g1~~TRINITY_DN3552_c0_g1_i4.p1  ORF type:complete len:673 (+),score=218.51 TRINITY_DN3552_c0_g1_i4:104-2122(+)
MARYYRAQYDFTGGDDPIELSVEQGTIVVSVPNGDVSGSSGWLLVESTGQQITHLDGNVRVRGSAAPGANGTYRCRRGEPHGGRPVWEKADEPPVRVIWFDAPRGRWVLSEELQSEPMSVGAVDALSPVGVLFDRGTAVSAEGFVPEGYLAEITEREAAEGGAKPLPADGERQEAGTAGAGGDAAPFGGVDDFAAAFQRPAGSDAAKAFGGSSNGSPKVTEATHSGGGPDAAGFGAPAAFDQPAAFGGRPAAFDAPPAAFDAPPAGFDAPPAGFDAPPAGFDAPPAGFDAPPAGFDAPPAAAFDAPPAFGASTGGFDAARFDFPPPDFGSPSFNNPDFGKPAAGFSGPVAGDLPPPPPADFGAGPAESAPEFTTAKGFSADFPQHADFTAPPATFSADFGTDPPPPAEQQWPAGGFEPAFDAPKAAGRGARPPPLCSDVFGTAVPPAPEKSPGIGATPELGGRRRSFLGGSTSGSSPAAQRDVGPATVPSFVAMEPFLREKSASRRAVLAKSAASVTSARALIESCRETNGDQLRCLRDMELAICGIREQLRHSVETIHHLSSSGRESSEVLSADTTPPSVGCVAQVPAGQPPVSPAVSILPRAGSLRARAEAPAAPDPFKTFEDPFTAAAKMGRRRSAEPDAADAMAAAPAPAPAPDPAAGGGVIDLDALF